MLTAPYLPARSGRIQSPRTQEADILETEADAGIWLMLIESLLGSRTYQALGYNSKTWSLRYRLSRWGDGKGMSWGQAVAIWWASNWCGWVIQVWAGIIQVTRRGACVFLLLRVKRRLFRQRKLHWVQESTWGSGGQGDLSIAVRGGDKTGGIDRRWHFKQVETGSC